MKKILSLLVACMLIMSVFVGCKDKDEESSNSEKTTSSTKSNDEKDDNTKESGGIKIDLGKSGTNLKLPKNFPEDVVPLIKDANIVNVIDNKEAMAMGVTFTAGKDFEYAVDFYKDVLKVGEDYSEIESDTGTILYGFIEGYGVTVTIVEYDGKKVSIMLNVAYNRKDQDDEKDDPADAPVDAPADTPSDNPVDTPSDNPVDEPGKGEESYFTLLEEVEIPEEYPKDIYPILEGDKTYNAMATENESGIAVYLSVASERKMKEIVDYYEKSWGTLADKSKQVSTNDFVLSGAIGNDEILITGTYYDDKKVVEYLITIYTYKETVE
jgi:hypothetical protein